MKIQGKLSILSVIHKFNHGFGTLLHAKWVSAPGFHVSVAGFLGVVGLFFVAKEGKITNFKWSSVDRDDSLESNWVVPGLRNLGNNCFLNVILQALASCSCFQSFLQKALGEFESLLGEDWVDSLPLTVALASLMEELCNVKTRRIVLNPRKLMLVLNHYISNFNLANQQDAEEAFFHILSSLREELSSCYIPLYGSLADVTSCPNCRILPPKHLECSEQERWRQSFLGPFDGILGSNLTCESCSFQISLEFQFFHSLHLSPVLSSANIIMPGCSVEDCLKQFFVAERLENYFCSHCWHVAAIKYLSSVDRNETDIGELRRCNEQDLCECKNLTRLKSMPWSNNFSHTYKQLSIAHSPKILCIHLQRVSVNEFGEPVKLQGHISFPLILDLHPFVKSGVETRNWEKNLGNHQHQSHPYSGHINLHVNATMLGSIYGQMGKNVYPKAVSMEELDQTALEVSGDTLSQVFQNEPNMSQCSGCSGITFCDISMQSDNKVDGIRHFAPSKHMYRLVSVVQHFGGAVGGHYTIYRRVVSANKDDDLSVGLAGPPLVQWFSISDSEVHLVSDKDVLGAEASLLFYEKISPLS